METETAVHLASVPPGLSIVTATMRSEYAEAIAGIVGRVAAKAGAAVEVARQVQAAMLHKVFHWMRRKGTHFLDAAATIRRLERLAGRLVDRELRRQGKERLRYGVDPLDDAETRRILAETRWPNGPIHLGTLIKTWNQLTYPEQRVLRLHDLKYTMEDIGLILDISTNAAEFYGNQARQKIQKIYRAL